MEKNKLITLAMVAMLCFSPLLIVSSLPTISETTSNASINVKDLKTQQDEEEIRYGGTLKTYMGDSANTLNPLNVISVYDSVVISRIFDSLVGANPYDVTNYSAYTGVMVRSFTYSKEDMSYQPGEDPVLTRRNGTAINDSSVSVWTFELREGYYWHDGVEITADDLVFTYQFDKWITLHATSESLGDFMPMMEYYRVEKLDKYTAKVYTGAVGFELKQYPLFLTPWPKHIYGKASTWVPDATGTFNVENTWTQDWGVTAADIVNYIPTTYTDPILTGSGPWILDYADAKAPEDITTYLYRRNPYYYWSPYDAEGNVIEGREWKYFDAPEENNKIIWPSCRDRAATGYLYGPYADKLKLRVILTEEFEWEAFKREEIDFAAGRAVTDHRSTIDEMELPVYENPEWGLGSMHLQCNKTYFLRDRRFRRAMGWAIDKIDLINEISDGYGIPLDDPVTDPPYGVYNWEPPEHRFDAYPGRARDLVTSLPLVQDDTDGDGLVEYTTNNTNIKPFELMYRSGSPLSEQQALMIEEDLEDAGIPTELVTVTWDELIEAITTGGFQGVLHGWTGWAGGIDWLIIWACEVAAWSMDEYHWVNSSYTENFLKIMAAESQEEAVPPAKECQKILYYDVPAVHLARDVLVSVARTDKFAGVIPGESGTANNGWSYRFMTLRAKKAEKVPAKGFGRPHNAKVSGEVEFGANFTVEVPGTPVGVNYMTAAVDEGTEDLVTDWELSSLIYGSLTSFATIWWNYEVDTTEYANGKHVLTLRVYGLTTEPLVFTLVFQVDNPVPITQRALPMAAISGVVGAIVVGAAVYMLMRRKRPPVE